MKLKHEEVNSPSPEAQNPPYRAIPVSPRPWWQAEVLQLKRSPRSLKAEHASPVTEDAQLPRAHAPLTPLPVSPPLAPRPGGLAELPHALSISFEKAPRSRVSWNALARRTSGLGEAARPRGPGQQHWASGSSTPAGTHKP